jgi:[ribosomal protein S5]-alanine N-acetyltransferase
MKIFAETERLLLREMLPDDINGMFELDSDPEVHRYLGNQPVADLAQLKAVIEFVRKQYLDNGIGRWAVVEKASGNFIGWSGLKLVRELNNNHIDYHDLGYRLIRKYWGQGYATEAAIAALAYGFGTMNLKEIFAAADVNNAASNRVLQKVGFRLVETFDWDDARHNWYKIDRMWH